MLSSRTTLLVNGELDHIHHQYAILYALNRVLTDATRSAMASALLVLVRSSRDREFVGMLIERANIVVISER